MPQTLKKFEKEIGKYKKRHWKIFVDWYKGEKNT